MNFIKYFNTLLEDEIELNSEQFKKVFEMALSHLDIEILAENVQDLLNSTDGPIEFKHYKKFVPFNRLIDRLGDLTDLKIKNTFGTCDLFTIVQLSAKDDKKVVNIFTRNAQPVIWDKKFMAIRDFYVKLSDANIDELKCLSNIPKGTKRAKISYKEGDPFTNQKLYNRVDAQNIKFGYMPKDNTLFCDKNGNSLSNLTLFFSFKNFVEK